MCAHRPRAPAQATLGVGPQQNRPTPSAAIACCHCYHHPIFWRVAFWQRDACVYSHRKSLASSGSTKAKRLQALNELKNRYQHKKKEELSSPSSLQLVDSRNNETATTDELDPTTVARNRDQAHHIFAEIVATERTYVAGLQTLVDTFLEPASAQVKLGHMGVPVEQVESVFNNVGHCYSTTSVLKALEKDTASARVKQAALPGRYRGPSIFSHVSVYSVGPPLVHRPADAGGRVSIAQSVLDQWRRMLAGVRRPVLQNFIAPVQRICKYPLFFRDLLKRVPQSDPGGRR